MPGTQLAGFVHMPKTGGTNVYNLLQGKQPSCGVASEQATSCGPHGMIVASPMQIGLVAEHQWRRTCSNPKRACFSSDDGASCHTATGVTCGAFRGPASSTSFSGFCTKNMHWQLEINLHIAAWARRSGLEPVMFTTVRNPWDYYVSHYLHALRAVRATNGSDHGGCGGPNIERKGRARCKPGTSFACLDALNSSACRTAFAEHLDYRLAHDDAFETRMAHFLGGPISRERLVPRWAWLRVESLQQDFERLFSNVTGLRYPAGCTLRGEVCGHAAARKCYAEAYRTVEGEPSTLHRCLLYTSPSPRDKRQSRMPSSA